MEDMDHPVEHGASGSPTDGIEIRKATPEELRLAKEWLKQINGYSVQHWLEKVHGYTCGICDWGRDRARSYEEYTVHMAWDHVTE